MPRREPRGPGGPLGDLRAHGHAAHAKHLTGLDFGMPSLTFQAYYEARFGPEAWEALDKIPKELWCVKRGGAV